MKKVVIFFLCLYIFTCLFYNPDHVEIPSGLTDRFLFNLAEYSDAASTSFTHLDLLTDARNELVALKARFESVPDRIFYSDEPSLIGIFYLLETLAICIVDILVIPAYLFGFVIVFIVDTITLILNTIELIDIFDHTLW